MLAENEGQFEGASSTYRFAKGFLRINERAVYFCHKVFQGKKHTVFYYGLGV